MMKGAGSADYDYIKLANKLRDVKARKLGDSKLIHGRPDVNEGYQDWHSIVGDDDLEDNPNT